MKKTLSSILISLGLVIGAPAVAAESAQAEVKVLHSKKDFQQTVEALTTVIQDKGMTVFAVIDHQAAATEAGLKMQPAKVIVFGAPKAGTPLMVKDPLFALSLPLKVLVTELPDGKVVVAHSSTQALIAGSKITFAEVENSLAKAEKLIANVLQK